MSKPLSNHQQVSYGRRVFLLIWLLVVNSAAHAQQVADILDHEPGSLGEGWQGFTDFGFLLNAFLTLTLAAVLGAIIAYHPKNAATADTLEEIEAPKVYITYSVIGALIGIMVVKYGLVVGCGLGRSRVRIGRFWSSGWGDLG